MSYARFGWDGSDVYVFYSVSGMYECCFCRLQEREWVDDPSRPLFQGYFRDVGEKVQQDFPDVDGIIAHLRQHQAAGHTVPEDTFTDIVEDAPRIFGAKP